MNKVDLKRYMKDITEDRKREQENKYVSYGDKYLISNYCSAILLNDSYGLEKNTNEDFKQCVVKIFENFKNNFIFGRVDITEDIINFNCENYINGFMFKKEYATDIKKEKDITDYGIDLKKLKTIKGMIKADKIELYKQKGTYGDYVCYVIKLENTKTKEYGFLLPIRSY